MNEDLKLISGSAFINTAILTDESCGPVAASEGRACYDNTVVISFP